LGLFGFNWKLCALITKGPKHEADNLLPFPTEIEKLLDFYRHSPIRLYGMTDVLVAFEEQ
jgi:hypothetical protein